MRSQQRAASPLSHVGPTAAIALAFRALSLWKPRPAQDSNLPGPQPAGPDPQTLLFPLQEGAQRPPVPGWQGLPVLLKGHGHSRALLPSLLLFFPCLRVTLVLAFWSLSREL